MPAGIIVYNDNNIIQIDSDYKNLCLRSKVTVTCNVAYSVGATSIYSCAAQNYSGITNLTIALRSTEQVMIFWISATQFSIVSPTNGASVTVYLFGDPPAVSENAGLQIYNSAGGLVFDASRRYMRVVDIIVDTNHTGTNVYPAGKTYATVLSGGYWGRAITTGAPLGSPTHCLHEWKRLSCKWTSVTMDRAGIHTYFEYYNTVVGTLYESRSKGFLLVLDVTGY